MVLNKRIIFHIGPPKTGSSAIQHFLHLHREKLAEHGVVYPHHRVDENGISSGNARTICEEDREGRLVLSADKLQHVLANFAKATDKHILLFSSESFFRIADTLSQAVPDAEIICFVRNPIEYQLSIYNQSVKRHSNTKKFNGDSSLNVGLWKRLLALKEQVSEGKFHSFAYKMPGQGPSVINDVLSVLGLSGKLSVNNQAVNKSYTFEALELKRWLNRFPIANIQRELDSYLQSVSENDHGYRLIDDATLNKYNAELAEKQADFTALLDEKQWRHVNETSGRIKRLPIRLQADNATVNESLIARLRKEKLLLYLALAAVVNNAAKTKEDKTLFPSRPLLKLASAAQRFLSMAVNIDRKWRASNRVSTRLPPESSEKLACVPYVEVIPQGAGSSPACVKGGLRGQHALPDYASQFRFPPVANAQGAPQNVTDITALAEHKPVKKRKRGSFFYGGPVFTNFGHFLAESVHRLACYQDIVQQHGPVKVIFQPQRLNRSFRKRQFVLPARFYEVLAYLGVESKYVELPKEPLRVDEIWVAPQASLFRDRQEISPSYRAFLCSREQANGVIADATLPRKLYVTRDGFLFRGAYAAESVVASLMQQHGFTVFRPQEHDIITQLRYYKSAEHIVFAEGAALHILELMGHIPGAITVFQRRKNTERLFAPLLEARCDDVAFFSDVHELPSLFVVRGHNSAAHGSALSFLDAQTLPAFMSERLGIHDFNHADFMRQTMSDIAAYYHHYKPSLSKRDVTKKFWQPMNAPLCGISKMSCYRLVMDGEGKTSHIGVVYVALELQEYTLVHWYLVKPFDLQ